MRIKTPLGYKGLFMASQLNSTQLDVELSTRSQREQLSLSVRVSIATQLNSTQLNSTSSWVELRRYERAFSINTNAHEPNGNSVAVQ